VVIRSSSSRFDWLEIQRHRSAGAGVRDTLSETNKRFSRHHWLTASARIGSFNHDERLHASLHVDNGDYATG